MLLFKNKKLAKGIVLFGGVSIAMVAIAGVFSFSSPEILSENSSASKTKLVRMGDGWLISTYGDAYVDEYDEGHLVYDTKADAQRLARDIFVTVCHPANNEHQCSQADDWSAPINVSNTARVTSIDTKWNETLDDDIPVLGDAEAFYGDSGKPNIFNAGNYAMVTWVDKYCEGGAQRIISYNERGGVSVPFSCVYAAYTNNVSGVILDEDGNKIEIPVVWNTLQLTSGERDAKSDANKGVSITYEVLVPDTEDEVVTKTKANWVISWQEDPHGLQLGGLTDRVMVLQELRLPMVPMSGIPLQQILCILNG